MKYGFFGIIETNRNDFFLYLEEAMELATDLVTIAKNIDVLIDHLPGAHVSYETQVSH